MGPGAALERLASGAAAALTALLCLLGGSWDLVSRVINKVTLIALLTKSHDPPSRDSRAP